MYQDVISEYNITERLIIEMFLNVQSLMAEFLLNVKYTQIPREFKRSKLVAIQNQPIQKVMNQLLCFQPYHCFIAKQLESCLQCRIVSLLLVRLLNTIYE